MSRECPSPCIDLTLVEMAPPSNANEPSAAERLLQTLNIDNYYELKEEICHRAQPQQAVIIKQIADEIMPITYSDKFTIANQYRIISLAHISVRYWTITPTKDDIFEKISAYPNLDRILSSFYSEIYTKLLNKLPTLAPLPTWVRVASDATNYLSNTLNPALDAVADYTKEKATDVAQYAVEKISLASHYIAAQITDASTTVSDTAEGYAVSFFESQGLRKKRIPKPQIKPQADALKTDDEVLSHSM